MESKHAYRTIVSLFAVLGAPGCSDATGAGGTTDDDASAVGGTTTDNDPTGGPSTGGGSTDADLDTTSAIDGTSPEPTDGSSDADSSSSTTAGAEATDGTSTTGPDAVCGNGVIDVGEECDDAGESAACDLDCTLAECGDGSLNATAGEICDGDALAGESCETLGWVVGSLVCDAGCGYDTADCSNAPLPPTLTLSFAPVKRFEFAWAAVPDAETYELLERARPGDLYVPIATDLIGESLSLEMPLHLRHQASYVLRACNVEGCSDSLPVDVMDNLASAVGYVKASNTGPGDDFGIAVALSADGDTLAVGAYLEESDATGIDGDGSNDLAPWAGAVYVYVRQAPGSWAQQAFIKASAVGGDQFGISLSLDAGGDTLAVGARFEDSGATGIDGDQGDDSVGWSGASYVFVRDDVGTWAQQAYIKASNTGALDEFGRRVALSGNGDLLIVGAPHEDSNATGIDADGSNDLAANAGAAYVFVRDGAGTWAQDAYLKASDASAGDLFGDAVAASPDGETLAVGATVASTGITPDVGAVYVFVHDDGGAWIQQAKLTAADAAIDDEFGASVALSGDGSILAVGVPSENSSATGIDGNALDFMAPNAGAVYVFGRDDTGTWSQQTYIKASNTASNNYFGRRVSLSAAADVLAVGAHYENGDSIGLGGDETNTGAEDSGAVYVFDRDDFGSWQQRAYVKAPNTDAGDFFGTSVALSADATTLATGASRESSSAVGIGGDQANNAAGEAGAAYLH